MMIFVEKSRKFVILGELGLELSFFFAFLFFHAVGRVCGDETFFGFGGDDLDVDVVLAGKEEALTDWEVGETFLFFLGKFKDVRENIYGGGGLFQEDLHGGVVDDSTPHLATHKVFYILGDGGETEVILTGTLGETEEEVSTIFVFHELPGLVDEEEATLLFGADNVPDVGENDIHGYGTKFVFEVANVEDDHLVINVDVRLLGKDTREGTSSVLAETVGKLRAGATHVKKGVVKVADGGGDGLVG